MQEDQKQNKQETVLAPLKLPYKFSLLIDFNGYVLAKHERDIADKSRTEYVTWQKSESGGVVLGHYYNDIEAAKDDFAKRSELINPDKMFSKDELAVLYKGLKEYEKSDTVDFDNEDLCDHIESVRDKLEHIPNVDINKYSKITVLVVEPNKEPYEKKIINNLHAFKEEVGGYIEVVYPFDDNGVLVCNEEGKLQGLPTNRMLNHDDISGIFIVTSVTDNGDFMSLNKKQVDNYKDIFSIEHEKDSFVKAVGNVLNNIETTSDKIKNIAR